LNNKEIGRKWQPVGDCAFIEIARKILATGSFWPGFCQWVAGSLATATRAASQPWIDTCLMLAVVIATVLVY
jgi:hypothetical protein